MSAEVTLTNAGRTRVYVDAGNAYEIDRDGFLHVLGSAYGNRVAAFKPSDWAYVVISPNRGPNGRFVKKGFSS